MGFPNNIHNKANIPTGYIAAASERLPLSFCPCVSCTWTVSDSLCGQLCAASGAFSACGLHSKHQRCAPAFPVLHSEAGNPAGRKCQSAGGIHDEGALVLSEAATLIVVIVLIFLGGGSCQQSSNCFRREALPEFNHSGRAKGAFAGVFL